MEDETLAAIKEEDIKYLESGQISKYVYPISRKKAHERQIAHLIVRVFIMKINAEGKIHYLLQKRNKTRKSFPNHFTDSASGHVLFKEDLNLQDIKTNAIREAEEELGISKKNFEHTKFQRIEKEEDNFTGEIAYIFFCLVNPSTQLNPDPKEVDPDATKFYSKEEVHNILKEKKNVDYSRTIWKEILNTNVHALFSLKERKENKKEIALFLGRFQPFHKGHVYVLEQILETYEQVKIGIGSAQLSFQKDNPFTAAERRRFILETLNQRGYEEQFLIYEIPDIFNASKWVDHVVSIVGDFDTLFSNSDWVRELFINKDYPVPPKITLEMDKYNGTRIRQLIAENNDEGLDLVPQEVANLIEEINGVKRIKDLYEKEGI